jgi:hypothetical protein
MNEEKKLQEKWEKLRLAENKAWDDFDKMDTKEKLSDILEDFKKQTAFEEIFGKKESGMGDQVTLHFDTANKEVGVYSDKLDAKGRPLLQWEMNTLTGHTTITKRTEDGTQVEITHKELDPTTLSK